MEVTCKKCEAILKIPDNKIPKGQQTVISCPRCNNRQTVDVGRLKAARSVPKGNEGTVLARAKTDADYMNGGDESEFDFFEDRTRLAIVMENDVQQVDRLRRAVEELGYRYVSAENSQAAISKMRLHQFDVVILFDRFDGVELTQSPILEYLNHLPLSVRRKIFLALIGDDFKTMDHMSAFAMSANVVIDGKDLGNLQAVLKHAISDNERFYKVFMDTLDEVGKG